MQLCFCGDSRPGRSSVFRPELISGHHRPVRTMPCYSFQGFSGATEPVRPRNCRELCMRALYVGANRPSRLCQVLAIFLFLLLWTPRAAIGAEYQGRKVDGMRYSSFVHSLVTGKY